MPHLYFRGGAGGTAPMALSNQNEILPFLTWTLAVHDPLIAVWR
nr:MAG TPA_asm: hypothetical protein [Caudoviricetes sp.]